MNYAFIQSFVFFYLYFCFASYIFLLISVRTIRVANEFLFYWFPIQVSKPVVARGKPWWLATLVLSRTCWKGMPGLGLRCNNGIANYALCYLLFIFLTLICKLFLGLSHKSISNVMCGRVMEGPESPLFGNRGLDYQFEYQTKQKNYSQLNKWLSGL